MRFPFCTHSKLNVLLFTEVHIEELRGYSQNDLEALDAEINEWLIGPIHQQCNNSHPVVPSYLHYQTPQHMVNVSHNMPFRTPYTD